MLPSTAGLDAEATTERLRAREYMRRSRQFLRQTGNNPWGFVIYRTVYGPGSDANLTLALEKIKQHIINMVSYEIWSATQRNTTIDSTPVQQIVDTYQPEIRQGSEFDQASDATIRAHFNASINELEQNMDNDTSAFNHFVDGGYVAGCIVLDEESLQSVINSPDPVPGFLYPENVEIGEFKMLDRVHTSARMMCDQVWYLYDHLMRDRKLVDYTRFDKKRNLVVFKY